MPGMHGDSSENEVLLTSYFDLFAKSETVAFPVKRAVRIIPNNMNVRLVHTVLTKYMTQVRPLRRKVCSRTPTHERNSISMTYPGMHTVHFILFISTQRNCKELE